MLCFPFLTITIKILSAGMGGHYGFYGYTIGTPATRYSSLSSNRLYKGTGGLFLVALSGYILLHFHIQNLFLAVLV